MFSDLNKIPIIGDFIIAFAITVVLTSLSSAAGYFGYVGESKEMLINIFIYIGIIYFICSLGFRVYLFLKKSNLLNK